MVPFAEHIDAHVHARTASNAYIPKRTKPQPHPMFVLFGTSAKWIQNEAPSYIHYRYRFAGTAGRGTAHARTI